MLEFITEGLGALVSGGALGLIGSFATNLLGYLKGKQGHEHTVELKKLDMLQVQREHQYALEQIKAEAEFKKEQLVIESERDLLVAEYQAMAKSYQGDQTYYGDNKLLLIAEFIRRITRPGLTLFLVALTTAIYFSAAEDLQSLVARSVVAMTATVVSWWFADRQIAKQIAGRVL